MNRRLFLKWLAASLAFAVLPMPKVEPKATGGYVSREVLQESIAGLRRNGLHIPNATAMSIEDFGHYFHSNGARWAGLNAQSEWLQTSKAKALYFDDFMAVYEEARAKWLRDNA